MKITTKNYLEFIKCPKMHYLDTFNHITRLDDSRTMFDTVVEINNVAFEYLADMIESKYSNMECKFNQSFEYENLSCFIDLSILDPITSEISLYFIKHATKIDDEFKTKWLFAMYVLENLGYTVKDVNILYVNADYTFNEYLNLDEYFLIESIDLSEISQEEIQQEFSTIKENLIKMKSNTAEPETVGCKQCKDGELCPFFNYCYSTLPKNNIFNLSGQRMPYKLFNDKILSFEDSLTYLKKQKSNKTNNKLIEQIEYELEDKGMKVDKEELNKFLDTLSYPLYFLDFETIVDVVPFINKTQPFSTRVTQYSIHKQLEKDSEVTHTDYIAESAYDNLEEVAKYLIQNLGEEGSILVYHAVFEKARIEKLASYVDEELSLKLKNLITRIVDLETPFVNRYVYCKEMKGRSSLKVVLPALCKNFNKAYADLDIVHDGIDAIQTYKKLMYCNDENERESYIYCLKQYCALDTLAMVEILKELYKLAGE